VIRSRNYDRNDDFVSLKRVKEQVSCGRYRSKDSMPLGIWPSWMHNVANVTIIFC